MHLLQSLLYPEAQAESKRSSGCATKASDLHHHCLQLTWGSTCLLGCCVVPITQRGAEPLSPAAGSEPSAFRQKHSPEQWRELTLILG